MRGLFGKLLGICFSEVGVDHRVAEVNQWCEDNGYGEFVDVVGNADGDDLLIGEYAIEGNEQYDKAINELRYERGTRGTKPQHLAAGDMTEFLENKNVYELPEQERSERTDDDALSLAQDTVECQVHIEGFTVFIGDHFPPVCGRQLYGKKNHNKRIGNKQCCEVADPLYARLAKVFVDEVGCQKNHRPNDHTGGEVKVHDETHDGEMGRLKAHSAFC